MRLNNIKTVECRGCGADSGERCHGSGRDWRWCSQRILDSERHRKYGEFPDDHDYDDGPSFEDLYNAEDEEERERQAYLAAKERLRAMSNEDLGKEWQRECRRHDAAVDRCEQINSPTIEDAQGWMNFIDRVFEERGVDKFKYTIGDEEGSDAKAT